MRGIIGATEVTAGLALGAKPVALGAKLVPDFLAPSGIFLALGAKLGATTVAPMVAVPESERKILSVLLATTYTTIATKTPAITVLPAVIVGRD